MARSWSTRVRAPTRENRIKNGPDTEFGGSRQCLLQRRIDRDARSRPNPNEHVPKHPPWRSRCLKAWTHVVVVKCFRYRLLERATLETYLPFMGSGADEWDGKKETIDDNYNHTLHWNRLANASTAAITIRLARSMDLTSSLALRMDEGVCFGDWCHIATLWPRSGGCSGLVSANFKGQSYSENPSSKFLCGCPGRFFCG